MLDDPAKRAGSGVDGIIAGYFMLEPKQGMNLLEGIMKDTQADFMYRYAALRAARFIWDAMPDSEHRGKLTSASNNSCRSRTSPIWRSKICKWSQWNAADQVFKLKGLKSHDADHQAIDPSLRSELPGPKPPPSWPNGASDPKP